MAAVQQSVAWWCFVPGKMQPETLLRAAAEIGYHAIDLAPREYWQLIRDHGLALSAVSGHTSLTDGLNRRENRQRIVTELHENIALAAAWNIPNLICFSGNRTDTPEAQALEATAETLASVAQKAQDAGVTLVLELLNSKIDHPGYQCDHTAWGVQVCEAVNSPAVKLLYDIYHMQVMEGDIIRTIRENHARIGHYHTAGVPGRHEIDDSQELNYPAIMRAIAATGYTGCVAQEFIPTRDPVQSLRQAFDLCNL